MPVCGTNTHDFLGVTKFTNITVMILVTLQTIGPINKLSFKMKCCEYSPCSISISDQNYIYPEASGDINSDTLFILP